MIVSAEGRWALDAPENGSVVSVGVFDGVHLGHQRILTRNLAHARELGARATVVTFRDHPKTLLLGRAPRMLTSLDHRLELFRRAGIEHTLVLTFDDELRRTSAREFAFELCVGRLGARKFVLGFDSKVGANREGTPEALRALGLDVEIVPQVVVANRPVSSTAIREAVELGDLEPAARMLGRRVSVHGEVVRGDQLGRQLGFPTANLDLHHELRPPNGVWVSRARVVRYGTEPTLGPWLGAVTNIGWRPTLGGERPELPRVEAHLLDFEGDLYGAYVELEFVAALRAEQRFSGLAALRAQIEKDVAEARERLARLDLEAAP